MEREEKKDPCISLVEQVSSVRILQHFKIDPAHGTFRNSDIIENCASQYCNTWPGSRRLGSIGFRKRLWNESTREKFSIASSFQLSTSND